MTNLILNVIEIWIKPVLDFGQLISLIRIE